MRVLLTGGAGYIGAHVAVALARSGHTPMIVDSALTTTTVALRLERLLGERVPHLRADVRDLAQVDSFLAGMGDVGAVIHLAGRKSVAESVADPLLYYRDNVGSTIATLETATRHSIPRFIFSSSATVYGESAGLPLSEDDRVGSQIPNPYGRTKFFIEQMLDDWSVANPGVVVTALRYFNPVGADPSGTIGEVPAEIPANIMPYIAQVAAGLRPRLRIFGGDYPTPDGTGLRDYIHVQDLAAGHVAALARSSPGWRAFNLGTGVPTSVLQLVRAFEEATGCSIDVEICERRAGDVATSFCDVSRARLELDWTANTSITRACADHWRWQRSNPNGYS